MSALTLAAELVGIDSVNPALVPGGAGETAIVGHLEARLRDAGFDTTVVDARGSPGRPSLVARGPGPDDVPTVVLNGHLDTVGVAGCRRRSPRRSTATGCCGRGAADMKGGVAAIVAAAEHLVATGAPVRPVLALVADEEDASIGSEAVIAALPGLGIQPDVCLIAEPTGLALARSLRGFALVRVGFTGRAAHSSQPEPRESTRCHAPARLVVAVDERAAGVRERWRRPDGHPGQRRRLGVRGPRPRRSASSSVAPSPASRPTSRSTRCGRCSPRTSAPTPALEADRDPWRLDAGGPAADLSARPGDGLGDARATSTRRTGWRRRCGRRSAPPSICGPTGGGHARGRRVGRPRPGARLRPGADRASSPAWAARRQTAPCRLTRAACAATRRCSTPGCASTSSRRRRSRSPATSNDTTWSATSWPATCRCTPGSTR